MKRFMMRRTQDDFEMLAMATSMEEHGVQVVSIVHDNTAALPYLVVGRLPTGVRHGLIPSIELVDRTYAQYLINPRGL
jgi:hypothetical protein